MTHSNLVVPVRLGEKVCTCYVAKLPRDEQWELRYGAHALDCPVYRRSRDPVDDVKDRAIREHLYG